MKHFDEENLHYELSARKDFRTWLLIVMHIVFSYFIIPYFIFWKEPSQDTMQPDNVLFWFALVIYLVWCIGFVGALKNIIQNPSSGSFFDSETEEFVWWRQVMGVSERVASQNIAYISIDDSGDITSLSVYTKDNRKLPFFDIEVVPHPCQEWAQLVQKRLPHIDVKII